MCVKLNGAEIAVHNANLVSEAVVSMLIDERPPSVASNPVSASMDHVGIQLYKYNAKENVKELVVSFVCPLSIVTRTLDLDFGIIPAKWVQDGEVWAKGGEYEVDVEETFIRCVAKACGLDKILDVSSDVEVNDVPDHVEKVGAG